MDAVGLLVHTVGGADTGSDPVFLAARDLVDNIRIGNVRARHADHVHDPFAYRVARVRHVRHTRRVEDGQADLPPKLADNV